MVGGFTAIYGMTVWCSWSHPVPFGLTYIIDTRIPLTSIDRNRPTDCSAVWSKQPPNPALSPSFYLTSHSHFFRKESQKSQIPLAGTLSDFPIGLFKPSWAVLLLRAEWRRLRRPVSPDGARRGAAGDHGVAELRPARLREGPPGPAGRRTSPLQAPLGRRRRWGRMW